MSCILEFLFSRNRVLPSDLQLRVYDAVSLGNLKFLDN